MQSFDPSKQEHALAKITYVKENKSTNLLRLGIVEGEVSAVYTVRESAYSEIGRPIRGDTLTVDDLLLVRLEDEYVRAKRVALSMLAYGDNNERAIMLKLCKKGIARSIAEDVAREMVSLGYVDEPRQIERLLLNEANLKLNGARKIILKLVSKGYGRELVHELLSELVARGEICFAENAKKLVEKKLPSDATSEEKKKLLYRYGYNVR